MRGIAEWMRGERRKRWQREREREREGERERGREGIERMRNVLLLTC
jgi:hypothetical protein